MSQAVAVELIKAAPGVLWVGFAVLVYLTLRPTIVPQLTRLSSVRTPILELGFAEKLLDDAATKPEAQSSSSRSERRAAVSRLEHAAGILKKGSILWVDDNPDWNWSLIRLFREIGMTVDTSRSTQEALAKLQARSYDLIISDMRRNTEKPEGTAGITLIEALRHRGFGVPVVIYAANFDPSLGVHPDIFAYTNTVDGVLQYVIDVMERIEFGVVY